MLLGKHSVRDTPSFSARRVAYVGERRPITLARTVLPVLARRADSRGRSWVRVRLPGRVLGAKRPPRAGWISAAKTRRSSTGWHIIVNRRLRKVLVYRAGRRVHTFRAIVGSSSTPTPRGAWFVEETVRLPGGHSGAPFALATSARSNVLQEFDGGPGQIALHGLRHVGGRLGTAVSHGCIRLANGTIAWLAHRIGPGVPVTIL